MSAAAVTGAAAQAPAAALAQCGPTVLDLRQSFLITLSAIAELRRDQQVATGFEDLYFFGANFLRCFGLFVADAQCNRRKGIVVRLALRAIADDRAECQAAGV